ncbi:MAG: hypothetical protein UR82_C0016G0011 [Candidatus Moranbacteria bacterium GW2011_GWF1_35_5]|nr:MAG: hypothetical protein UR82_C0016G0011 [Candidatus Moranbacteria bacterium GW2011_GWF1_35_5]
MKNEIFKILLFLIVFLLLPSFTYANIFADFNDFSVNTGLDQLPSGSATWDYDSTTTMDRFISKDISHAGGPLRFWRISPGYNTSHMGFENYGFLEIDDQESISGSSLRYAVTGGRNTICNPCLDGGLIVNKKQDYIYYLESSQNPLGTINIGDPYIYFGNDTSSSNAVALWNAQGHNRLSMYVKIPPEVNWVDNGYAHPTIHIGPFTTDFSGHYYHQYCINGGDGWVHLDVDRHPTNDNVSGVDSVNMPAHDVSYISNIYRFYFTISGGYEGFATPMHYTWFDNIEFLSDDYANQNDESINNLAIAYSPSTKYFQVSFNDKYRGNWNNATPAHIQDGTFQAARNDGKFRRAQDWAYLGLWAKFKLGTSSDEDMLELQGKIYFAVKDISQNPLNHEQINPALDGTLAGQGRDYLNGAAQWDYENDDVVLDYIKRIDYSIAGDNTLKSDVDNSSATNTTDALLTLRNSLGLSMDGTAWQMGATTGDVDCSGSSNSTDALLILRYSLGLSMDGTRWCE